MGPILNHQPRWTKGVQRLPDPLGDEILHQPTNIMRLAAQVFLLVTIIWSLKLNVHRDLVGREARKPFGTAGVVCSVLYFILYVWALYLAGALS
jgi:hypothetical protein